MSLAYRLGRRFLFQLDPETAHRLAIAALRTGLMPAPPTASERLRQRLLGLDFPNPLGMAAGFDKEGEAVDGLFGLGFGFVEVGTTTPLPQSGNPPPRLFRLPADRALINRLGFNSRGHDSLAANLARRRGRGIVGVNLGANRDSADRIADYVAGVARFAAQASYLTINISSPNTPGLRALQESGQLAELLARIVAARAASGRKVPLLIKIAPDLDDGELADVAEAARRFQIEGIIVANTTLARDGLVDRTRESGGLSGRPLFHRSTVMLAKLRRLVGRDLVLIGAGGVDSADTAFAKIAAGANLVQLYTGLVYEGPGLVATVLDGLMRLLDRRGLGSISDAVGMETEKWAKA